MRYDKARGKKSQPSDPYDWHKKDRLHCKSAMVDGCIESFNKATPLAVVESRSAQPAPTEGPTASWGPTTDFWARPGRSAPFHYTVRRSSSPPTKSGYGAPPDPVTEPPFVSPNPPSSLHLLSRSLPPTTDQKFKIPVVLPNNLRLISSSGRFSPSVSLLHSLVHSLRISSLQLVEFREVATMAASESSCGWRGVSLGGFWKAGFTCSAQGSVLISHSARRLENPVRPLFFCPSSSSLILIAPFCWISS